MNKDFWRIINTNSAPQLGSQITVGAEIRIEVAIPVTKNLLGLKEIIYAYIK